MSVKEKITKKILTALYFVRLTWWCVELSLRMPVQQMPKFAASEHSMREIQMIWCHLINLNLFVDIAFDVFTLIDFIGINQTVHCWSNCTIILWTNANAHHADNTLAGQTQQQKRICLPPSKSFLALHMTVPVEAVEDKWRWCERAMQCSRFACGSADKFTVGMTLQLSLSIETDKERELSWKLQSINYKGNSLRSASRAQSTRLLYCARYEMLLDFSVNFNVKMCSMNSN